MAKSNTAVLEGQKEVVSLLKSYNDAMNDIKDTNESIISANEQLAKSIAAFDGGVSTEKLEAEKLAEEAAKAAEGGEPGKAKFDQGQVVHALQKSSMKLYDDGKKDESAQMDKHLGTAQAFNYNMAAEGFPEPIKRVVEDYYRG